MLDFCELYWQLDSTTKTSEKVNFLVEYFDSARPADAAWAVYFLTGKRIPRLVGTKLLRTWATEIAEVDAWLFEECYDHVGDLAETISLIVPPGATDAQVSLHELVETQLLPLKQMDVVDQKTQVLGLWSKCTPRQTFVLGKLMMGAFRVGVSAKLVHRALAKAFDIEATAIAHRLMGEWEPTARFFDELVDPNSQNDQSSKPYPFFLANPIKDDPTDLGKPDDWCAEWKWDGIRAQVIRRSGETYIWTRGEELATAQFPEVEESSTSLPDGTVIDGEILAWDKQQNIPMDFNALQRRLGRKKVGPKIRSDVPVILLAFDLLECSHKDLRQETLTERQAKLREILAAIKPSQKPIQAELFNEPVGQQDQAVIRISEALEFKSWGDLESQRAESKENRAEGVMLKRKDSTYQVGRPVGDWWKWKVEPFTIDAVLIYAQRGHGRRASLYTDFTFAVWQNDELVPFAKAYSGLTDDELRQVDRFVKQHTNEKFGPVRSVTPTLVFELAFENIQRSTRHKSGIAVRFPRISRWRHDKQPKDADHLETILEMIDS